jgi:hypothetical protein
VGPTLNTTNKVHDERGRNGLNIELDSIFFRGFGLLQCNLFLHHFGGMAWGLVGLDSCITLDMDTAGTKLKSRNLGIDR